MTTDPDIIDKAADEMHSDQCPEDPDPGETCTCDIGHYDRLARILADAGLLRDSDEQRNERMAANAKVYADLEDARAELELWRSGQRRKFWPKHPDMPDAMGTAANLARAQSGEDEAHDSLLREAAMTIKALNEGYGYAVAERDAALAKIDATRSTNKRLNRRLQVQEAAINELASGTNRGKSSPVSREIWERCQESHDRRHDSTTELIAQIKSERDAARLLLRSAQRNRCPDHNAHIDLERVRELASSAPSVPVHAAGGNLVDRQRLVSAEAILRILDGEAQS